MRALLTTSFSITALALCANADNTAAQIGIPGLGLVYDGTRGVLRQVVGTPGAAVVGAGIPIDFAVETMAAGGGSGITVSAEDGGVRVMMMRGQRLETAVVAEAIPHPDRIVMSASGRASLLCDSKAGILQVLTGLPHAPVAGQPVSVSELTGGGGWKLAVSDDGLRVAIGAGSALWLLETDGGRAAIPTGAGIAAVAFRPGDHEATAVLNDGTLLRARAGGVEPAGKITGADGLDAAGLQIAADGTRVFVAYAQGYLAIVESGSAETLLNACGCKPAGLMPSNRPALYRLNEVSDSPLLFWDVSASLPRVWFVPVATAGGGE